MLTRIDYKYFQKAKQVAAISDFTKIHVGCVAVYQGSVIGIGCNSNKTHPRQNYYNRYRATIIHTLFQSFMQKSAALTLSVIWI